MKSASFVCCGADQLKRTEFRESDDEFSSVSQCLPENKFSIHITVETMAKDLPTSLEVDKEISDLHSPWIPETQTSPASPDSFSHLVPAFPKPTLKRRSSCHAIEWRMRTKSPDPPQLRPALSPDHDHQGAVLSRTLSNPPQLRPTLSPDHQGAVHSRTLSNPDQSLMIRERRKPRRWDSLRRSIRSGSERLVEFAGRNREGSVMGSNSVSAPALGRRSSLATSHPRAYDPAFKFQR